MHRKLSAQTGTFTRTATVDAADPKARTVELAFSSEYDEGERLFGIEILGHAPGEVDLARLNGGAPLLLGHDHANQIGVVESARIDGDRVGRALVRFSKSAEADAIFQDVVDGIRRHVSVGYRIEEAIHAGTRDGVDVFRVVRWQPFEISIVPVPFDPTVGIGRSATPAPMTRNTTTSSTMDIIDHLDRTIARQRGTEAPQALSFAPIIRAARQASGFVEHTPVGFNEPTHVTRIAPASIGVVRLADMFPAPSQRQQREMNLSVTQRAAGAVHTIGAAVMNASRVLSAGARLVPVGHAPAATHGDVIAWTKKPARFEIVTAPAFDVVEDDADASVSPLPLASAEIELADAPHQAICFKLTRRDIKDRDESDLDFIIARAISLGLARVCDAVVLGAIVAADPDPFTVAAAASRGLKAAELSAICGTAGTGAAFGADGVFRVNGVQAEMSDVVAPSIVAAFGRVGVACNDEMQVIVKRTSVQGDVELVCYLNVQALLPSPDHWVAA